MTPVCPVWRRAKLVAAPNCLAPGSAWCSYSLAWGPRGSGSWGQNPLLLQTRWLAAMAACGASEGGWWWCKLHLASQKVQK